jgi:hypothetical protein
LKLVNYFLLLDAADYHERFYPTLAASWRTRSFAPCQALCASLLPKIRDFGVRYQLQNAETLASSIVAGLPFDRTLWHHLVGEVLWYGAAAIPEIQTTELTLTALLAPDAVQERDRGKMPPILQAHRGSRDLVFGGGFYRPDHAGCNDIEDVVRLAAYLAGADPASWLSSDLTACQALAGAELEEELADARAWFPSLVELYELAATDNRMIVCESL